jgi:hypothetical protein
MNLCQICGAPATRTVTDQEYLPDETFWQVDNTSPPWHLCDDHAGSLNEYRDRLKSNLTRAERLLASLDDLGDDLRDSWCISKAASRRQSQSRFLVRRQSRQELCPFRFRKGCQLRSQISQIRSRAAGCMSFCSAYLLDCRFSRRFLRQCWSCIAHLQVRQRQARLSALFQGD